MIAIVKHIETVYTGIVLWLFCSWTTYICMHYVYNISKQKQTILRTHKVPVLEQVFYYQYGKENFKSINNCTVRVW